MVKSNQRITKIKRDPIEELLKKAEATPVENACTIQPQGMDLTPYPDMNNLRLWTNNYLLNGLNATYINNIDASGQTYLTTIVDGLPLFTKLTKTIKQKAINPPPITDFKSYQYYYGYYSGSPTVNNIGNTINIPAGLHVKTPKGDLTLSSKITYTYDFSTNRYILLYNSNDYWNCYQLIFSDTQPTNSTGEQIAWFNTSSNDWNIISSSNNLTSLSNDYATPIALVIQQSSTVTSIETNQFIIKAPPVKTNIETSKPGLWLSNLCEPYQVSQAGGWLRQNLINHSNKEFDTINSDTIGNYSFSFFQRGIIHRDAGSTHADNDSYCQHWSPSALGCISHDSIIIPTNNLRNTYTSYQTLAVPSDVNMQYYSETPSKDVEFTFVDNNDNIPLTTTSFNGQVVGDGWTFEYLVSGNHQGSGTWTPDAGCDCDAETVNCEECPHCWSCVSEDIRNSGLCITGEIEYQNADGTVCIQAVNECFQTTQAAVQPDNPNMLEGNVLGEPGVPHSYSIDYRMPCGTSKAYYFTDMLNGCSISYATATISNCGRSSSIMLRNRSSDFVIYGTECTAGWAAGVSKAVNNQSKYILNQVVVGNGSTCNASGGTITVGFKPADREEASPGPQENVNVYFCVTDEKKKQEAQGIPWNYTCGLVDRFSFSFSTTQCEDDYTKSYLVAENISISALGDITGFNEN